MSLQPRNAIGHVAAFLRGSDPVYRERSIPAIIRLLVLVSVFYGIGTSLISFSPAWRAGYHSYFRAFGNAAFGTFLIWPHASVRFLNMNSRTIIDDIRAAAPPLTLPDKFPVPHRDKERDTLMLLKSVDPQKLGLGQLRTSSRAMGYWPTLTVVALSLAVPWGLRRKLWLLLWAILAVHVFLAFRLAISLLQNGFVDPDKSYRLFELSPWWFERLKQFDTFLNDNITFSYVGGVFVWLMVMVAMELWPVLWRKASGAFGRSKVGGEGGYRRQTLADLEAGGRASRRRGRG
jgi:hypothetical protein